MVFTRSPLRTELLMLQLARKHILAIEVAKDIREIIKRSLGNTANWQVSSVNSIAEGLALIQTQQPDVILLEADLLARCDRHIWQQLQTTACNRSIPIIFMASRVRAMDRLQFQQLGAAKAIALPFDPQELVEAIVQLLK
ncbi:response regulator receiver (plasmid) [Stanieria cyanosphaera PCC 7437]|uniref:Response regulator receiver n=2 Tax=Stanieria cyanosphaera TaxID=102116 RepID=K9Y160_STAC7|nr:response regulator receiver [Stanieria cyanosphaera PCC 7437]